MGSSSSGRAGEDNNSDCRGILHIQMGQYVPQDYPFTSEKVLEH